MRVDKGRAPLAELGGLKVSALDVWGHGISVRLTFGVVGVVFSFG